MTRIFITGQCSLHWGRLEYGNIGNYYIIEPLFKELLNVFPEAEIVTTFQMTDDFCERKNIKLLPMDLFYGWKDDDLEIALKEFEIAKKYNQTQILTEKTPYIEEVLRSDLIMDVSGENVGRACGCCWKKQIFSRNFKKQSSSIAWQKNSSFCQRARTF